MQCTEYVQSKTLWSAMQHDTIRYDTQFALEDWQASCSFNLAHKQKKTKRVLNGNEIRKIELESPVMQNIKKIQKQTNVGEIEA